MLWAYDVSYANVRQTHMATFKKHNNHFARAQLLLGLSQVILGSPLSVECATAPARFRDLDPVAAVDLIELFWLKKRSLSGGMWLT